MLTTLSILTTTLNLDLETAATTQQLSGSTSTFGDFLSTVIQASMVIAALMVLLYLLWAGIDWVTAGGDNGKIEKARTKITQSIIGIIVLASTIALFNLIQNFLGINVIKSQSLNRFGIPNFSGPPVGTGLQGTSATTPLKINNANNQGSTLRGTSSITPTGPVKSGNQGIESGKAP